MEKMGAFVNKRSWDSHQAWERKQSRHQQKPKKINQHKATKSGLEGHK